MRPEFIIAAKDLRLLARDRMAAFFAFLFPLAVALFFGFIFSSGGDSKPLEVAVWNAKKGGAAEQFVKSMQADSSFTVTVAESREQGEALVRRSNVAALVVLPDDFDTKSGNLFGGNPPTIDLVTDPSRSAEAGLLSGKLYQFGYQSMFQRFSDPSQMDSMFNQVEAGIALLDWPADDQQAITNALDRVQAMRKKDAAEETPAQSEESKNSMGNWTPIKIATKQVEVPKTGPTNMFAISFLQGIAWGLFGAVLGFSSSMADERERGTLLRLLAAPLQPVQVLLGKATACFITCMALEWMLVVVGWMFFGVTVTSWLLFALASVLTAFAFTGIMMVLASLFRTQGGAQGAGRAAMLVLAMIGGGTVPVFIMPTAMRIASNISPYKWAIAAAEGATWRGLGIEDLWVSYLVLIAIGVVGTMVGVAGMKRRMA